jgi:hypothetical protein
MLRKMFPALDTLKKIHLDAASARGELPGQKEALEAPGQ